MAMFLGAEELGEIAKQIATDSAKTEVEGVVTGGGPREFYEETHPTDYARRVAANAAEKYGEEGASHIPVLSQMLDAKHYVEGKIAKEASEGIKTVSEDTGLDKANAKLNESIDEVLGKDGTYQQFKAKYGFEDSDTLRIQAQKLNDLGYKPSPEEAERLTKIARKQKMIDAYTTMYDKLKNSDRFNTVEGKHEAEEIRKATMAIIEGDGNEVSMEKLLEDHRKDFSKHFNDLSLKQEIADRAREGGQEELSKAQQQYIRDYLIKNVESKNIKGLTSAQRRKLADTLKGEVENGGFRITKDGTIKIHSDLKGGGPEWKHLKSTSGKGYSFTASNVQSWLETLLNDLKKTEGGQTKFDNLLARISEEDKVTEKQELESPIHTPDVEDDWYTHLTDEKEKKLYENVQKDVADLDEFGVFEPHPEPKTPYRKHYDNLFKASEGAKSLRSEGQKLTSEERELLSKTKTPTLFDERDNIRNYKELDNETKEKIKEMANRENNPIELTSPMVDRIKRINVEAAQNKNLTPEEVMINKSFVIKDNFTYEYDGDKLTANEKERADAFIKNMRGDPPANVEIPVKLKEAKVSTITDLKKGGGKAGTVEETVEETVKDGGFTKFKKTEGMSLEDEIKARREKLEIDEKNKDVDYSNALHKSGEKEVLDELEFKLRQQKAKEFTGEGQSLGETPSGFKKFEKTEGMSLKDEVTARREKLKIDLQNKDKAYSDALQNSGEKEVLDELEFKLKQESATDVIEEGTVTKRRQKFEQKKAPPVLEFKPFEYDNEKTIEENIEVLEKKIGDDMAKTKIDKSLTFTDDFVKAKEADKLKNLKETLEKKKKLEKAQQEGLTTTVTKIPTLREYLEENVPDSKSKKDKNYFESWDRDDLVKEPDNFGKFTADVRKATIEYNKLYKGKVPEPEGGKAPKIDKGKEPEPEEDKEPEPEEDKEVEEDEDELGSEVGDFLEEQGIEPEESIKDNVKSTIKKLMDDPTNAGKTIKEVVSENKGTILAGLGIGGLAGIGIAEGEEVKKGLEQGKDAIAGAIEKETDVVQKDSDEVKKKLEDLEDKDGNSAIAQIITNSDNIDGKKTPEETKTINKNLENIENQLAYLSTLQNQKATTITNINEPSTNIPRNNMNRNRLTAIESELKQGHEVLLSMAKKMDTDNQIIQRRIKARENKEKSIKKAEELKDERLTQALKSGALKHSSPQQPMINIINQSSLRDFRQL